MNQVFSSTGLTNPQSVAHAYTKELELTNFTYPNQRQNSRQNVFKKYTEFMGSQNNMITKILMHNGKITKESAQKEISNKLRDSSNGFINSIMSELNQSNSKQRAFKANVQQKIKSLQFELEQAKLENKFLRANLDAEWISKQEKSATLIKFFDNELKSTIAHYEQKLSVLHLELEKRQKDCDYIFAQKLQLSSQLSHKERLLRMEREEASERKSELSGMELLILEYQSSIQENANEAKQNNKSLLELRKQVVLLETRNNEMSDIVENIKNKLKQKECIISNLKIDLQHQKAEAKKNVLKNQHQQVRMSHQKDEVLTSLQDKNSRIEKMLEKLNETEEELRREKSKCLKMIEESKHEKLKTKQKICKIEKMFKAREKLVKKSLSNNLKQLKTQSEKLKQYFQNQIFVFYQDFRAAFMLGKAPQLSNKNRFSF